MGKELHIEVGKFYKTRGGLKVRIYAKENTLHGAFFDEPVGWVPAAWLHNGFYHSSCEPSRLDIISEWREPHPLDGVCSGQPIWVRGNPLDRWKVAIFHKLNADGTIIAVREFGEYGYNWNYGKPYIPGEQP